MKTLRSQRCRISTVITRGLLLLETKHTSVNERVGVGTIPVRELQGCRLAVGLPSTVSAMIPVPEECCQEKGEVTEYSRKRDGSPQPQFDGPVVKQCKVKEEDSNQMTSEPNTAWGPLFKNRQHFVDLHVC